MPQLNGLAGVKGPVEAVYIFNTTEGMRQFKEYRAITAAGDKGALTVWKRDDHEYGCERYSHMVVQDSATLTTLAAVRIWLRENLHHIF